MDLVKNYSTFWNARAKVIALLLDLMYVVSPTSAKLLQQGFLFALHN